MGRTLAALLLLILLWCLIGLGVWARRRGTRRQGGRTRGPARVLRPRTPEDCAQCRAAGADDRQPAPPTPALPPWRAGTRRRGAPRRLVTEGYACPMRACAYFGITDSTLHALVGDGHHGKGVPIQNFRCQACGTKVSARWGTPLYRLSTLPPASARCSAP